MRNQTSLTLIAALMLGACTTTVTEDPRPQVSEAVRSLAAPNQDVDTARLMPEDGCYWYLHAGPVETTLLPLRTPRGNPICAARPAEKAKATQAVKKG